MVQIGDTMPAFHAYDQEGNLISSEDLLGSLTIVYFYPKDDTPGCTKEACDFRDAMDDFDSQGVIVIGISPDPHKSHNAFIEKHELNFELLSDPELEIAKKFGAVTKKGASFAIERATFLIDAMGTIVWREQPVAVDGHAERVLKAIDSHAS